MNGQNLTKRYARALYEVSESEGDTNVAKDVAYISGLMENREIRNFCIKDTFSAKSRREFAEIAIFPGMKSKLSGNFVNTVLKNDRIGIFPFLAEAFREIDDEYKGVTTVFAEFANTPEADIVKQIVKKMESKIVRQIRVEMSIKPELLKGFRVIWNNRLIDNSFVGRLRSLRKVLLKKQS